VNVYLLFTRGRSRMTEYSGKKLKQIIVGFLLLLTSWGVAQQQGGTLVVAAESMGDTLEPGLWTGFGSIHVLDNVGEGLVRSDFTTGDPQPGLAESWTISEDGLTYTFTLRQGVKFHDGTDLTAQAVVRSLSRYTNAEDPSYAEGFYMQSGHGAGNWASLTATDDSTVTLVLSQPDSTQLHRLSRPSAYIISSGALDEFGGDIGTNYVGTGPFSVERFVPGQEANLVAFEDYWGGRPYLDQLVIRAYPDEASILAALESGEVTFTTYAPFTAISRLKASDTIKVDIGPALVDLFIGASAKNAPSDNLDIRLAVNYAVNRETLILAGLDGYAEMPSSILSPTDLGFDPSGSAISSYNPDLAKEHIAKSGLPTPVAIDLAFESNRFWPQLAELIKADLEAVGFQVNLDRLDSGTFWGKAGEGALQFSINQRSTFVPDPNDKVLILHSVSSPGGQTWHELLPRAKELDALIDAGIAEQDEAARVEIYKQIQTMVLEDMPYIYLGYLTPPVFTASNVQGVPVAAAAAGRFTLGGVWLE
jgi:peptide/nickel transport system substrate-binding protein